MITRASIGPLRRRPLRKLHRPRWARRLMAFLTGYFWLPCPICRRRFSGREAQAGDCPSLYIGLGRGVTVCPECVEAADQINQQQYAAGLR